MKSYRYWVDVVVFYALDGTRTPCLIRFNTHWYRIDEIRSVRQTTSRAGGCGTCYECRFGSQIRFLFEEGHSRLWFLESEKYVPSMLKKEEP